MRDSGVTEVEEAMFRFVEKAGEVTRQHTDPEQPHAALNVDNDGFVRVSARDLEEMARLFWEYRAARHMGH